MSVVEELIELNLLIGGENKPASDRGRTEVLSPATGEVVGTVAAATLEDLEETVKTANQAFVSWSALTAYERQKILLKATVHVRTKADEIGRMMALEQGKPFNQSRGEVVASCDTIDYYAAEGVRVEGYSSPTEKPNFRSWVNYHPVGVCAMITPWNYPVALLSWKLGPALAVGCTAIVKPTPVTPMCATAFCQALVEGGVPAGVLSVLTSPEIPVAEALIKHPKVAKVAMTGSTATGKRLMEVCGPLLRKISLELGGHCPAVVCEDADLDNAAKIIAYKGFRNMGQSCSSVNRVYVHRSKHDALVAKLKAIAEGMSIGDGVSDGSVDLGPMATEECRQKVKVHVADAVEKGATLVCGGTEPEGLDYQKGHYYLPTILTNCTEDMLCMQEETFGPVVPFIPFDTEEEAVEKANDTDYGLVSYLFCEDMSRTIRLSEALHAGTVCVNHGAVNTNYAPYAGWKDSGYGLELSRDAVHEYLEPKHIKLQIQ